AFVGRIIDGTGKAPFDGVVLVEDGKIGKVGSFVAAHAEGAEGIKNAIRAGCLDQIVTSEE
ncbi:MAG: hypothetical protein ACP5UP_08485, partial [Athalassotoga sp.]